TDRKYIDTSKILHQIRTTQQITTLRRNLHEFPETILEKGDLIRLILNNSSVAGEKSRKMQPVYSEKFEITDVYPNGNLRIVDDLGNTKLIHKTNAIKVSKIEKQSKRTKTRNTPLLQHMDATDEPPQHGDHADRSENSPNKRPQREEEGNLSHKLDSLIQMMNTMNNRLSKIENEKSEENNKRESNYAERISRKSLSKKDHESLKSTNILTDNAVHQITLKLIEQSDNSQIPVFRQKDFELDENTFEEDSIILVETEKTSAITLFNKSTKFFTIYEFGDKKTEIPNEMPAKKALAIEVQEQYRGDYVIHTIEYLFDHPKGYKSLLLNNRKNRINANDETIITDIKIKTFEANRLWWRNKFEEDVQDVVMSKPMDEKKDIERKVNKPIGTETPIVVGQLNPPKLRDDSDIIEWENELTLYFRTNQIPSDTHQIIARSAMNPNARAKIEIAEKYRDEEFKTMYDIINFLFKESNGEDSTTIFRSMRREINECPSLFLQRLEQMARIAFDRMGDDQKRRNIEEQFTSGINDRIIMRKLLTSRDKTIKKLIEAAENEFRIRKSVSEASKRGLMSNLNVEMNNCVIRSKQEKKRFGIRECKFCRTNSCLKHDKNCSYCWKGSCRKHVYSPRRTNRHTISRENNVNSIWLNNNRKLHFAACTINSVNVSALVDSGAAVSLISSSIATNVKNSLTEMYDYEGNLHFSLGKCYAKVEIDNRSFVHEFHVVKDLRYECILGNDFLIKKKLILHPAAGTIYFDDEVEVNSIEQEGTPVDESLRQNNPHSTIRGCDKCNKSNRRVAPFQLAARTEQMCMDNGNHIKSRRH
ncbi:hypothetical protein SNEBB_006346, partial [Seison nebaliae]